MKAITGATLIDGIGSAPLPDAVVLIEGSDIVTAGSAQSVPIPDGAEVVEARGMTLMPGTDRYTRPSRVIQLRNCQ